MEKDKIEKGDSVELYSQPLGYVRGVVLYVPTQAGDSWVIKTNDGTIIHLYNCDYVLLLNNWER